MKFNARLIFFVGENGSGKSNILESISLLSWLKSFRENPDIEMVSWDEKTYYIRADYEEANVSNSIEIGFEKGLTSRKKVKFNGNILKKKSDIIGKIITVVFSPDDLVIVDGGPGERRRFIDSFVSSVNNDYLNNLIDYNRILKNRNILLKKKADEKQIYVWDAMLIDIGIRLKNYREEIIEKLNHYFQKDIQELSGGKDIFNLVYKPNVNNTEEFNEKLKKHFSRDMKLGYTTTGIHRDAIFIGEENKDIIEFASQGQKRSVVISLKTSIFKMIRDIFHRTPILLIDDVIRELDVKRREYFINLIYNCGQAFFTTTDLEGIHDYVGNLEEEKQIFYVLGDGVVKI